MSGKKNNFLVQGSMLAMAGIFTRIIGLIYRIPLNNILGDGISAYTIAYDIYSLFLLISSLSLPLAVSKIVAARMARGEARNARRAFKGAIFLAVLVGATVSLLVFLSADKLAALWKFPSASLALKVLSPTLFVMCLLGVMRGFFQGIGSMMPTAVSQIIEQIINAIVSIIAAYILCDEGQKIGKAVEYSAAGGTLGTAAGALTALLFMAFVYSIYKKSFKGLLRRDKKSRAETYGELLRVLAFTIFPVLLSTTIYNLSSITDSAIYGNIMSRVFKFSESDYNPYWSIYSGHYRLLTTAPIAIASALSSAVVPSLIKSITNRDYPMLINKIASSVKLTMIIAIPCGIGLSVLADPILRVLFNTDSVHGDDVLLMRLAVLVVCAYSFSTITNSILQGMDKMRLPVKHSAIALILHFFILAGLLLMKTDVYGVAIADIIFAFTVCILNSRAIYRYTGRRQEIKKTFILPFICGALMGAASLLIYKGLNFITKLVAVPLIIAILAAVAIYGSLLMLFKVVNERELMMIPAGEGFAALFKRIGLL